jgi:hypothetical protein
MNWFNSLLRSVVFVFLVTPVFSETQITGGLLTCTPKTSDQKPDVYMFNPNLLVKQGDEKKVYKFVGDYRHYKLYVGTIPSIDLKSDIRDYNVSMNFLKEDPETSIKYLTFFRDMCRIKHGSTHPNDINYDQTKLKNENFHLKDVPDFWGVNCSNISKVLEKTELPKPRLTKENHIISKITVDTRDWSIVEQNSQLCEECSDTKGGNWSFLTTSRFWNWETSCVVVKLDKVEIDVTEDLVDEDEV